MIRRTEPEPVTPSGGTLLSDLRHIGTGVYRQYNEAYVGLCFLTSLSGGSIPTREELLRSRVSSVIASRSSAAPQRPISENAAPPERTAPQPIYFET